MGARPPESEFPAHPGFRYPEVLVAPLEVSTLPRPLTGEPNGQTQQTNLFAKREPRHSQRELRPETWTH